MEAIIDPKVKQGFNNTELFFINVGDYPEVMPYTKGRSPFLVDVGENYRGGGTDNMIYQSEEFVCKMGVTTRYHKGVDDQAVRRWDNPIHEIGHWVEIHGNYRNQLLNSPDFQKLPGHWQKGGIDEVFTIFVTAWFDSQYSYWDMPKTRLEFKKQYPHFYSMFQGILDESVTNIGQYCANSKELEYFDNLSQNQKSKILDTQYGLYPKSIIAKTGNKVPNIIQKQDSLYKSDYAYVIDNKLCTDLSAINSIDNSSLKQCANDCDNTDSCNRFSFNINTNQCQLITQYNCDTSKDLDTETGYEFQYQKISTNNKNNKYSNTLTTDEKLKRGEQLCSSNKKFKVKLQQDGNLCLYQAGTNNSEDYVWCSMVNNYGQNNSTGLTIQSNGDLVIYKDVSRKSNPIWSSKSAQSKTSGYTAVIQNDRNFVIYNAFGKPIWASNTWQAPEQHTLFTFKDCN